MTSSDEHSGNPMITFVDEHGMLHSFPVVTTGEMTMGAVIAALGQPGQVLRLTEDSGAPAVRLMPAEIQEPDRAPADLEPLSEEAKAALRATPLPDLSIEDVLPVRHLLSPLHCTCPWCGESISLSRGTTEEAADPATGS